MFVRSVAAFVAIVATATIAITGCSAAEDVSTESSSALSRGDVISRAEQWVAAELPYCQSINHAHDYDPSCSAICNRVDNAAWDPYRSDCSGLASWAWGLPAPGRVTKEFAPFQNDITETIAASDLQPGDAVNNDEHVMLFKAWVTPGSVAEFIEEPGCSSSTPYAHEFTSSVSISGDTIHVSYNGMTFYSIRLKGIQGGASTTPTIPTFPNNRVIATKSGNGYYQYQLDGAVFSFGDAQYHGGANTFQHQYPIIGMAMTSSGNGYWQTTLEDGAVYSFGDAQYHGGANTIQHASPVIAIAATAGSGYWQLTQDGAIYSFGDAQYYGGANSITHAPMIALAATPSGKGYWMLASDGAIYSFGDAQYHGGLNTIAHPASVAAFAPTSGSGYWIVAQDGAVYSFGDAPYRGGANTVAHPAPIEGIAAGAGGYWLSAEDGAIYSFGAAYHGGANAL
jgi:hypothetical protein